MEIAATDHALDAARVRPLLPEEDAIGDPDDDDDQDDTLPADLWY